MLTGQGEVIFPSHNDVRLGNLFANIPSLLPEEVFECILDTPAYRIERILSKSHVTPQDEWYDQACSEWVILLEGAALLRVESQSECIRLNPGDYIYLPAHVRHRVEWTDPSLITVWLAIHGKCEDLGQ